MTREEFETIYPEMGAARSLGMGMMEWEKRSMADKAKIIAFLAMKERMHLRKAQCQVPNRWLALPAILCYLVTGYCGHGGCGHVEPYGFVPEVDCPIHDSDSRLSRWARKVRRGRE